MIALIDADILPYEYGGMVQLEDPDKPLEWEIVRSMVDDRINQILEATDSGIYSLYLTDSATNFRIDLATIKPYKGHRKTEKPYHWERIRQHLIDSWDAEVQCGIEADDRLGIEQMKARAEAASTYSSYIEDDPIEEKMLGSLDSCDWLHNTVICSRDKDLHMIPGWHYVWPAGKQEEKLWFQDELSAIRCFYRQLLTGDSTDNILGLYGVGASSQLVKRVESCDEERLMFDIVYKAYQDRFGSYASMFMMENAALLWMLREEPDTHPETGGYMFPENEIHDRLELFLLELENEQ